MSKNKKKADKLNAEVSKLNALIDRSAADSAQLKDDVKELNAKVSDSEQS